jgi:hypothetical protein
VHTPHMVQHLRPRTVPHVAGAEAALRPVAAAAAPTAAARGSLHALAALLPEASKIRRVTCVAVRDIRTLMMELRSTFSAPWRRPVMPYVISWNDRAEAMLKGSTAVTCRRWGEASPSLLLLSGLRPGIQRGGVSQPAEGRQTSAVATMASAVGSCHTGSRGHRCWADFV